MAVPVIEKALPNKPQIRHILANANYLRLLGAQIIAAFGDRIHQMALLNFIIEISRSTNTTKHIADITFWGILPSVVLGPIALKWVDRWRWKSTMLASTLLRGGLALAMPFILVSWYNIHTAWVTAFMLGTFAAIFGPCRLAILPNLVRREDLVTTNAISSQVGTIATLFAVPFGGYLVNVIGRSAGFCVDGVAFMAAAGIIVLLTPARHGTGGPAEAHQFGPELASGLRYLMSNARVRFTIIFYAYLHLVSGIFYVCLMSYSLEKLGVEERGVGQLLGVMGIGMAAGAALLVWKPRLGDKPWLPYVALAGAGFFIWKMSQGGDSHFIALLLLGIGLCGILAMIPNDTFLQHHVPDRVRGRVFVVRGLLQGLVWLFALQFVKSLVFHLGLVSVLAWLGLSAVVMASVFGLGHVLQNPRNQ